MINWLSQYAEEISAAVAALATVVIAVYTVVLAKATKELTRLADAQKHDMQQSLRISGESANAAKRTVEAMERNAETELRAYVGVKQAFFRPASIHGENYLEAGITIVNSGKTTANDVRVAFGAQIKDTPVDDNFPNHFREGTTYMFPGIEWNIVRDIPLQLSQAIELGLQNRSRIAFSWGRIEYTDAFGRQRVSEFRFRNGLLVEGRGWDAEPDGKGNSAT